jgi:hypothetical protein
MSTYLLTVESVEPDNLGTRLSPGIRLSETKDRPAIAKMIQGARLELRRPDGQSKTTVLVTYGISVLKDDDGAIYLRDNPHDPEIRLILPSDVDGRDLAPGTEVWLLE